MELSYPELWFLQLCVDHGNACFSFRHLTENDEDRECGISDFNRRIHGLTIDGIGDVLWTLYSRGDIEFTCDELDNYNPASYFPASAQEITSLIYEECDRDPEVRSREGKGHWFSISTAGVGRWEEYAQPDWSRFVDGVSFSYHEDDSKYFNVIATSETRGRMLLKHATRDPTNRLELVRIAWDSAKVEIIKPWKPLPGKKLPRGVFISVDYTTYPECDQLPTDTPVSHSKTARDSCFRRTEKIYRWYRFGIEDHPDRPKSRFDACSA